MTEAENKPLVFQQKDSTSMEIDAIMEGINTIALQFQAVSPITAKPIMAAAVKMTEKINKLRQEYQGFDAIFSGNGPVARRLNEHVRLLEALDVDGSKYKEIEEIKKNLAAFGYNLVGDPPYLTLMLDLMQKVRTFADNANLAESAPALPTTINIWKLEDGLFRMADHRSGKIHTAIVVTTPASGAAPEMKMLAISGKSISIWMFHPAEGLWLECTNTLFPEDTYKNLSLAFDTLLRKHGYSLQPVDWINVMEELITKSAPIFENKGKLQSFSLFQHESEHSSIMMTQVGHLFLMIRDTTGHYPSRRWTLVDSAGSVSYKSITEFQRQFILNCVSETITTLLDKIENDTGLPPPQTPTQEGAING